MSNNKPINGHKCINCEKEEKSRLCPFCRGRIDKPEWEKINNPEIIGVINK